LKLVGLLLVLVAFPLSAQSRDRGPDDVPASHRPPPGMCRIWLQGVPPGQQPEPTDCATAVRERPAGARVIFGDRRGQAEDDRRKAKIPNAKGFAGESRAGRRGDDDDDARSRRPGAWPQMRAAVALARGGRTDDVQRWLGDGVASVRYDDGDRDGRPERAQWYDRSGQLMQDWVDVDGDGIADTIRLYRDGKLVRVYER
jgi:hypothetical protein